MAVQSFLLVGFLLWVSQPAWAIFNGVAPGGAHPDFPAVVKLVNSKDKLCSGVFISPTAMLTAAHCLVNESDGGLMVHGTAHRSELVVTKVGILNDIGEGKTIGEDQVKYDIAIAFFPKGASPATLESATEEPLLSQPMTLCGWGLTDPAKQSTDDKSLARMVGYTAIAGRADQKRFFRVSGDLTKITNDGTNAVPLPGDSGSPLLDTASKKIVGICSATREDKAKKTFVGDFVSLYSQETINLIEAAQQKRPGEIADSFVESLRPKKAAAAAPTAPVAPPSTSQPVSPTTKPTGSPLVGFRPKPKLQPDFLQLDDRLVQEISKVSGKVLAAGLVHTDQTATDARPDLRGALVSEGIIEPSGEGEERFRVGYSVDFPQELWLITQSNLRYLLIKKDGSQNLLVDSLKYFIPVKDGVIYFDGNWMAHFRSLDAKKNHAYKLRAYIHNFGNRGGWGPIYQYDPGSEKLVFANWPFVPASEAKDDAPQPDTFELSLIDFTAPFDEDQILQVSRAVTWPFFLRSNGLYRVDGTSQDKMLKFQGLNWNQSKLDAESDVLKLEGNYEVKQRNGEFTLMRINPTGPPTPLLVDSTGRLLRQTGRQDRFASVTDRTDRAMAALPINPKVTDLLDLPRRAPLYSSPRANASLTKILGGSRKTWAIVVYEDGQRPEEPLAAYAQKVANGSLTVPASLKVIERFWRIPGDTAFNSRDAEAVEEVLNTLTEALDGTRAIGYLADFPTKRAEAVDTVIGTVENFWHHFESCLTEGTCRIVTTMRARVYEEVAKKLPTLISQAASVIELPKLESTELKQVAQVLRRGLEQDYGKILSDGAFDVALKFGANSSKGKQSPEREEQLLRDVFDWAEEDAPRSTEIAASAMERFLNRERNGGVARKVDIEGLRKHLYANMIGHRDVIDHICDQLKPLENGTHFGPKPIYFTLLGTPGIGKSRITGLIANYLTGPDSNLLIDFKSFKGFDDEVTTKVFQKIKSNPNKLHVVTLDDVDRGTFNDLDTFRGVFDNGFFAKGTPGEVNFKNVVVILTANWGEKLILKDSNFDGADFLENLRRDIVVDDSKQMTDPNPRGKISNRVWRVLAGRMYAMKPFTEAQLFELALRFAEERQTAVSNVANGRKLSIHPMVLVKYISQRRAQTAGASDIQNSLEAEVFPVYETPLQKKGVTDIILVPTRDKITAVTNLDGGLATWQKSHANALAVIKEKGHEWFIKNSDVWFREDMRKVIAGETK